MIKKKKIGGNWTKEEDRTGDRKTAWCGGAAEGESHKMMQWTEQLDKSAHVPTSAY